ncbi:hypothetical protein ACEE90_01375 [Corynebacterium phoceense]
MAALLEPAQDSLGDVLPRAAGGANCGVGKPQEFTVGLELDCVFLRNGHGDHALAIDKRLAFV